MKTSPEAREDIMSNVYYKWDAEIMAELSEKAGYPRERYDEIAAKIRKAFRERYMKDGKFEEVSLSELIVLAARGFFDDSELPGIIDRIAKSFEENKKLITFGVHGIKMMSDLLCDNGYSQLLFDVVTNPDGPGYAKNVVDGLSCLAERFDYYIDGIFSLNHHFFCMVDTFFYRRLAGIRINDFASGDIVIAPDFVKGIDSLCATLRGITVSYDKAALKIESPYPFTHDGKRYPAGNYSFAR